MGEARDDRSGVESTREQTCCVHCFTTAAVVVAAAERWVMMCVLMEMMMRCICHQSV